MKLSELIKNRIKSLNKRHSEVLEAALKEADAEKRAALGQTLAALKTDIDEAEQMLKQAEEQENNDNGGEGEAEGRSADAGAKGATIGGAPFIPTASFGQNGLQGRTADTDALSTME